MSGPAIHYNELFGFEEYYQAIALAKDMTLDLAKKLETISERSSVNLKETLGSLQGMKVSIVSTKDTETLKFYNQEIEKLAESASNYRSTISGAATTTKVMSDSITAVEGDLKSLTKLYKSLSQEEKNNEEIGGALIKKMAELKSQTQSFSDQVKNTTKSLSTAEGSYNELSNELLQLKNELKNLPSAFDASTGALNEQNQEAVRLSKRIQEVDGAVKKMDTTMGVWGRNVGNYESGTVSLRQQLKEMTAELARMEMAGERNTEAYQQLLQKAGELKDTMGDVASAIRTVGSDTSTIEGLTGVLEGVAGGAAAAEGTMALFGATSESVTETIKRLQAVQSVLMGVQAVANMLQKESAAVLLVVNAQRKLQVLYTNLQSAAESKSIIIRKSAAAAQWVLNAAMKANPVGLLITVVAALATVFVLLIRRSEDAAKAQSALNEVQKNYYEMYVRHADLMAEKGKKKLELLKEELELAKAGGASQLEIQSIEQKIAEQRQQNASEQHDIYKSEIDNIDKIKNSLDGYENYLNRLNATKAQGIRTNVVVDYTTSRTENRKVSEEDITAASGIIENLKARYEQALSVKKEYEDAGTDVIKKALEDQRTDIEKNWKSRIANDEANLLKTKANTQTELEAYKKVVTDRMNYELRNENLTTGERRKIRLAAAKDIADKEKEFAFNQAQSENNIRINKLNAQLSAAKTGSNQELVLKQQLIDEQADLEALSVRNTTASEEEKLSKLRSIYARALSDKQDLEKQKRAAELENQYNKNTGDTNLEILKNRAVLADTKSTYSQIATARANLETLSKQAVDNEYAYNQKLYDSEVITFDEYEKRKTEIKAEEEESRIAKMEEMAAREAELQAQSVQVIQDGLSAISTMYSYYYDKRISQIESEKEIAVEAAGDNTEAKERIEKAYNKKINAEKRKQAKAEKIGSIFSIGLNTAVGIMKTVSQLGYPAALPFVILTALQGAIQTAAVAAKPLPTYIKGTMNAPEGPSIVNDQPGPVYKELIVSKGRAYLPSKRNQVVYLHRGDKVVPAYKTQQILSSFERNMDAQKILSNDAMNNAISERLDRGKRLEVEHSLSAALISNKVNEQYIVEGIGRKLNDLPLEENHWDDAGYRRSIRKGNTVHGYLNKRNSLS